MQMRKADAENIIRKERYKVIGMQGYKDQKDLRKATNAKMFNVMAGALILLDAITHTLLYAMSYFNYASEMSGGNKDMIAEAAKYGWTTANIQTVALVLTFLAIIQIVVGFIALRFNNRLDKANVLFRAAIIWLILQIIAHLIIFLNGMTMIEFMLIGVMLAGCLIWSSISFLKLAKAYPEKTWALESEHKSSKKYVTPAKRKSLRERAKSVDKLNK